MYKLVIADTSCLILLGKINRLSLLQDFFKEVYITEEVNIEYGEPLPDWIKIEKIKSELVQQSLELQLDKGEASAIALGLENEDSLLLIDERKGRKIAKELGLKIMGTLGILIKGKLEGKVPSLSDEINKLKAVDFRISEKLIEQVLKKYE